MVRKTNYSSLIFFVSCIAVTLGFSVPLVPGATPATSGAHTTDSRGGSPGRGGWQGGGGNAAAGPLRDGPSSADFTSPASFEFRSRPHARSDTFLHATSDLPGGNYLGPPALAAQLLDRLVPAKSIEVQRF